MGRIYTLLPTSFYSNDRKSLPYFPSPLRREGLGEGICAKPINDQLLSLPISHDSKCLRDRPHALETRAVQAPYRALHHPLTEAAFQIAEVVKQPPTAPQH